MNSEEQIAYIFRRVRFMYRLLMAAILINLLMIAGLIVGGALLVNAAQDKIEATTGKLDQTVESVNEKLPSTDALRFR